MGWGRGVEGVEGERREVMLGEGVCVPSWQHLLM